MPEENDQNEKANEENPFKLSEQVIEACSDYSDAFLVIGYTKEDRKKFFLAVHKDDEKAEELRKLSDAVAAWHGLSGNQITGPEQGSEVENSEPSRLQ
jgi:hypothetical protein